MSKRKKKKTPQQRGLIRIITLGSLFIFCGLLFIPFLMAKKYYLLLVIPFFYLVSGLGVLCLKNWARLLLLWINLPFNFFLAFLILNPAFHPAIFSEIAKLDMVWSSLQLLIALALLILAGIIQIYFTLSRIKQQFK